jgi:hypothetical protein
MPFRDDPRIDRLEALAAHLSWMREAAEVIAARQRGNLTRRDRDELERLREAHRQAMALLKELRKADDPHDR